MQQFRWFDWLYELGPTKHRTLRGAPEIQEERLGLQEYFRPAKSCREWEIGQPNNTDGMLKDKGLQKFIHLRKRVDVWEAMLSKEGHTDLVCGPQTWCTVGHKSHDPYFHMFLMEARVMTFVAHCAYDEETEQKRRIKLCTY